MQKPEEKVLLVDDEPRLLSGLRRRLSDRFDILIAESAAEAIRTLETNADIGVIVTDMRMPERNGIDLLIEVSEGWPNIRRMMLTGNNDQETAVAAVNRGGVSRFFRKPCDADELATALYEALDEYRFVIGSANERNLLEVRAKAGGRSRKAFLSMMSHELLTPLNHILGFASMLEMKLKEADEPDALEYLTYIQGSGENLLRLVQRVLEIVRFISGDQGRERKPVDVLAAIGGELNCVRSFAEERKVSVSFQRPNGDIFLETNEYELCLALREILDNAIKFNDPGGHVTVAVNRDDSGVTIRIADTGFGMAPETVSKALGIFHQGEDGIGRRFGGIGLGLTFVAFYARANSGRVAVESEEGEGTAVLLTLGDIKQNGLAMGVG